jgi:membrane fusion protein, multidrug efflux system
MKQYLIFALTAAVLLQACGNSSKDQNALLNDKKAALEKLKQQKNKAEDDIKKLEDELAKLQPNTAKETLVSLQPVATGNFQHFIDLRGHVDADNISYISPRGMPGQVKALYIRKGDLVKKGQLVLKLDDAIVQQQVSAAKQQMEALKTQLNFAKNIYQRQKNLWEQGIGTEVQLITAKTNAETLENQLESAREQIKIAEEQLKTTNVYSDVAGIADVVDIKVGETFQGMSAMGPQIKIVNTSSLKVSTNVPENYIGRIKTGAPAQVQITDLGKNFTANVSLISQSIDPTQRGFIADVKIPYDAALKPNQTAIVKIMDYSAVNAVIIPVNVVQTDDKGKYVFVAQKLSNGKMVATKKMIVIGEVYGDKVEVKQGLTTGEQLVAEGFQSLYEGQVITAAKA